MLGQADLGTRTISEFDMFKVWKLREIKEPSQLVSLGVSPLPSRVTII